MNDRDMILELINATKCLLDGASGYEVEHGTTDRYWSPGVLENAAKCIKKAEKLVEGWDRSCP